MPQPPHRHPPHHPAGHHAAEHHHPAAPPPLWTVTRQELNQRFVPGVDPVEEWTVYFVTRSGAQGWVTIPREAYLPDVVAQAVQPEAEQIEAIAHLHSEK